MNKNVKKYQYDDFVYGELNRRIDDSNLKRKVKSIKTVGLLSPITVTLNKDGKYFIIDGQHRYKACVELNHPITKDRVVVLNLKTQEEIVKIMSEMNGQLAKWKKMDYVETYAAAGNKTYQDILDFIDAFPDFGIVPYITLLSAGGKSVKNTKTYLERGEFEIGDLDMAYAIANDLMKVKEAGTNYYKHFQFVMAFVKLWVLPDFDIKVLVNQIEKGKHLRKDGKDVFLGVANVSRFRELICEVYNHGLRSQTAKIY